jgi:hypothetical protein
MRPNKKRAPCDARFLKWCPHGESNPGLMNENHLS